MDMRINTRYTLDLSKDEFGLVQRALRGALLPEEQAHALALQERLLIVRSQMLDQMAREAHKAKANIEATHETPPDATPEDPRGTR